MKGKDLHFTKEGVMYKYGKPLSLDEANIKSVGGKKFKSLKAAFENLRKELQKKHKQEYVENF